MSIGHNAIVHGCVIEDNVLVGMGAIVMDNARIGSNSIIAAGAVVLENTIVEPGSIYAVSYTHLDVYKRQLPALFPLPHKRFYL